ncbi:MAG: c-type cytochrome [Pseudomonadota bacterium]
MNAAICFLVGAIMLCVAQLAVASPSYEISGKHFDIADEPTYRIFPDGSVDWFTAEGYAAYHRSCQGCHGPRGAGSPLAPELVASLRSQSYLDFIDTVTNGRIGFDGAIARVMPAFGTSPDIMCRLDALFIYLRAESAGVLADAAPLASKVNSTEPTSELDSCLSD